MLSSVYLLDSNAIILIEKQFREKVLRSEIDAACMAIRDRSQPVPSIINRGDTTIVIHKEGEIWIVGACNGDEFGLIAVSILKHIGELLRQQFKKQVTPDAVKNSYTIIYQMLDLAVDFGLPFLDEPNTIQQALFRPSVTDPRTSRFTLDQQHPWRQMGIKRGTNEIYIDIVEDVDVVVNPSGRVTFSHIRGSVDINSLLSGDPVCRLVLSPTAYYEDTTFHRCVEPSAFTSKVIPFTPPDGMFTLMKYRMTAQMSTLPLWINSHFQWSKNSVTFEIVLKPEASLPKAIESLEVKMDLPSGVATPSFVLTVGKVTFDPITRYMVWSIGTYNEKDPITIKGSASLDAGFELGNRNPVITAKFQTIGSLVSNAKISSLEIDNISYNPFKGVKYVTRAGNYEFRTGLV